MKPTLVVLAAGMGSRYGKLKQMDGFGPNGETIIEYSLYDAINAGFGKVVFIIRESFAQAFMDYFSDKLAGKIDVEYVFQETDMLPDGFSGFDNRQKPWGTAHAIWVARHKVNEPFGVINADDYYGVDSYKVLADFLMKQYESQAVNYGVVAYYLRNTLSDHGTVNRGVCATDENKMLVDVEECIKIRRNENGRIEYPKGDGVQSLEENTLVSMNMWAFLPTYFSHCEELFGDFLKKEGHIEGSEFFIPKLIDHLIKNEILGVHVLDTESDWFGVTYQEDKPFVIEKINDLIASGVYPDSLWK